MTAAPVKKNLVNQFNDYALKVQIEANQKKQDPFAHEKLSSMEKIQEKIWAVPLSVLTRAQKASSKLDQSFFSSKRLYQVSEICLLTTSGIGLISSIGALASGMMGLSLVTLALSISNFVGAFFSHQIGLQRSLEENLEKLESQSQRQKNITLSMKQENLILKEQNEELSNTKEALSKEVSILRVHTTQLESLVNRLKVEVDKLTSDCPKTETATRDQLAKTTKEINAHINHLKALVERDLQEFETKLISLKEDPNVNKNSSIIEESFNRLKTKINDSRQNLENLRDEYAKALSNYEKQTREIDERAFNLKSSFQTA